MRFVLARLPETDSLMKAYVAAHRRRLPNGQLVWVDAYRTSVQKKPETPHSQMLLFRPRPQPEHHEARPKPDDGEERPRPAEDLARPVLLRQPSLFDQPTRPREAEPEPRPRPTPREQPAPPVQAEAEAEPPIHTEELERVAPIHPDAKGRPTLMDALMILAGECDGARTQDGAGFNQTDTSWGKNMALVGSYSGEWDDVDRRLTWERLRKYKGQLLRNGLDFDQIAVPPPIPLDPEDQRALDAARTRTRGEGAQGEQAEGDTETQPTRPTGQSHPEDGEGVWRWIDGHAVFIPEANRRQYPKADVFLAYSPTLPGRLSVRFQFDQRKVALIKTIRGARWNPAKKEWHIPADAMEELPGLFEHIEMHPVAMRAWEESQHETLAKQEARAQANSFLSEFERGFTQDILTLTPDQLQQVDTLDDWTRTQFLPSNLGKPRHRMSAKQLNIVERAQGQFDEWLEDNPAQRALLAMAWKDREGELRAAVDAKDAERELLAHDDQIDVSDFTMPAGFNPAVLTGGELYPHQKQGVEWLTRVKSGILAFATALGKTNTSVTAAVKLQEEGKAKRCLFIVPSARKIGTVRDIQALYPGKKVVLVDGTPAERARQYRAAESADFVIAGYGLIQREPEKLKGSGFDVVINDEAVRLKGKSSQTAKNAREHFRAPYTWDLSATPIPNSPEDLYQLMHRLQPDVFGSRAQYMREHCATETVYIGRGRSATKITGYKNLAHTRETVAPYIMARTWQSPDVKIPMPERRSARQTLDLSPDQSRYYEAARAGALDMLRSVDNPGQMTREQRASVLTNILRMEQVAITPELVDPNYTGEAPKVSEAVQIVKDHFGAGHTKACVIYSHYLPVIDILHRELQKEGFVSGDIATIKGGMTPERVQEIVDGINTGKHKVLIASDAAAEGLNLQHNSQMLLHMDTPWRPDILEQREGRIYRPGQTSDVVMMRLMTNTSVENHKDTLVKRKAGAMRAIVHGEEGGDTSDELSYEDFLDLVGATSAERKGMRHAA